MKWRMNVVIWLQPVACHDYIWYLKNMFTHSRIHILRMSCAVCHVIVLCAGNLKLFLFWKSHLKWASKVAYHLSIQFVSIQCCIHVQYDEPLLFEMNSTNDNNKIQNEKNCKEPKHTRTAPNSCSSLQKETLSTFSLQCTATEQ